MKKSKFTEEQIAFALKQADTGTPVKEVIRKIGITEQTFYRQEGLNLRYRQKRKRASQARLPKVHIHHGKSPEPSSIKESY